jgi:hypothetical protein
LHQFIRIYAGETARTIHVHRTMPPSRCRPRKGGASHISRSAGLSRRVGTVSPTCSRQGDRRPGNSTHSTGLSFQIKNRKPVPSASRRSKIKNTLHTAPSSHPRLDIRCPCHFFFCSLQRSKIPGKTWPQAPWAQHLCRTPRDGGRCPGRGLKA